MGSFVRRLGRRSACAALLAALFLASAPSGFAQQSFVPSEALVTSRVDLFDMEFNQKRAKIAWVDAGGKLWVAAVDRKTGLFKPSNGQGVLVDADALTSADLKKIGNGPEWLLGSGADRIVYTKFPPGLDHTLENARIAMAEQNPTTLQWSTRFLSDLPRNRPYASTDPVDPAPRVSYIDAASNPYWREVDNPATETLIPAMSGSRALAVRFVQGQRSVIYPSKINGLQQVVRYWLDTGELEQLTFDDGVQPSSSPFMWKAPEFGGDYVLMASAIGSTEVRIYRHVDKSRPEWTVVHRIVAPAPGTKLASAEPFVFNGKSYIFMSGVVPPNDYASVIYLANIDAATPLFRQLTPDTPLRTRADPEVFVTSTGPFVYFYRADRTTKPPCPCYDGIFMSDTGLRAR